MTAGSATFRSISVIFTVLVVFFGMKEGVLHLYPLLENFSPERDWWEPFISSDIAELVYPNSYVTYVMSVFWGGCIGLVIGGVSLIIDFANDVE